MRKSIQNLVEIVIPTHNRTDFLKRVLDYYAKTGTQFNFIIADSSSPKNKLYNRKLIKSYPTLKISYIDSFPENLEQHVKFSQMVKFIKLKYCVFCPDDDFIVPSGIKECVKFLEKNPDYSAAHGTYLGFYLFKGVLGNKSFWWNFRYSNSSITAERAGRRVFSYLCNLNLVMWAVRRTNLVKSCYKELSRVKFDPFLLLMYGELLPDTLTVLFGKVKRLKTLYAARQYFFSIATNYVTLNDAVNTTEYQTEYAKFRSSLVKNLIKLDNLSRGQAIQTIDLAMERYLKYSYQEYLVNKVNRTFRYFPLIQKILRLFQAIYLFSKDKTNQLGKVDQPSSKYFNDFEVIRQIVLQHNI